MVITIQHYVHVRCIIGFPNRNTTCSEPQLYYTSLYLTHKIHLIQLYLLQIIHTKIHYAHVKLCLYILSCIIT